MKQALLFTLMSFLSVHLFAQTGTEFWVAPPDVTVRHNNPGDEPIYLNVTTGNAPAVVTVSQPANPAFNGGAPIVLNVPANSAVRHDMTALKAQLETRPTNTVRNTGLLVQSTADITCYYESSNTNNPDILALKGANGLGYEFYIPLHKHAPFHNHDFMPYANDLAFASFDIVATQNNTTVLIYSPVDVDGHQALTPFTVYLDRGETYSCANTDPTTHDDPTTHPSGAVVLSNKPVAVSIKDDSNHNPSGGCYDLMLDQIVPVDILGTDYVAVKGQLNTFGDESLFIMAVQNNTQVYVDGNPTPVATLFAGQYYRHDMDYLNSSADNSAYVSASKPVYAIHVTGFGCEQGMAILPPLNCAGSTQLSFTRSTSEPFYLNLLVRAGSENDFVVNGPGTATIPGSAFQPVPGTGGVWLAAQIQYNTTEVPVNQAFIVSNTSDVFSLAIINGGATSGCRYGFFSEFAGEIVVDAGPDRNLCAGEDVPLAGSVSGGSTTGIWTSTGTGTFQPNDTDLNATYVPSIGDLALGSVTLTLTSTGNCTPESDNATVTFQPVPVPDAGPAIQACSNNPAVPLSGSVLNAVGGVWTGGAGTFLPANNDLNATYTPTMSEVSAGSLKLYLTTTGNGPCAAVTDSVTITFTPAPTANAGADQALCANNAVAPLNGSVTVATGGIWSGGSGNFDPSTTNMGADYTPTAAEISAGSVTLTLTTTGNGNCLAVADNVTLTFTDAPVVNAGADQSACANNASVTLAGSVTGATGAVWSGGLGAFAPSATALNAVYTPTAAELAAGSVTLTLTSTGNGSCLPVNDAMTISFTPAPIVDAGTGGSVCSNAPSIALNGTVTGATGGIWSGGAGTFTPNNTTLSATYAPTAAEIASGSVTLTLTSAGNGTCNPESDAVTWTFTPSPTATAGADQSVCANNADVMLNGGFTVSTGAVWSGGGGSYSPGPTNMGATYTPTPVEIASGSVTLTLTTTGNGGCLPASDQVTISFTPGPVANAGADLSVCENNATVGLGGVVSGASGGIWSGGAGSFTPNNTTLNATYSPTAAEIAAGVVTLTLTSTGNGTCNAVSDQVQITFTPAPVVNAGADGTVCANNATITLNGSVTVATGGTWSGGAGTFSPNANTLNAIYTPSAAEVAAGSVTLTLTSAGNGTCNAVSDQVSWTISPAPTVNAGVDQTLCSNNANAVLNGSYTVASGAVWSGGGGSYTPGPTNMGATYAPTPAEIAAGSVTLTLTTTGNGNCVAVTDQVTLNFTPPPVANAGADITACANNASVQLNGSVGIASGGIWGGGAGSFVPNNTDLNATYTPTAAEIAAGVMTLTLTTTGNGTCNAVSDQVQVAFTPAPVVNAGTDGTVCANNAAIMLNGSVTGATGGTWTGGAGTFNPNPNVLNATYTPSASEIAMGSVTLTLTSAGNGNCNPVSDQVTWTITPSPSANAGVDRVLCANNAPALLSGSFTVATGAVWSGGAGTFDPSTTNMGAVYTPTAAEITAGSVTLTLTTTGNGLCNAATDQVLLTFTDAPTANAGPDVTVCANNGTVALNGSVQVATGGNWSGGTGTFSPNANTLNASYTPGAADIAAGQVTLTLTTTGNGTCNATADTRTIFITPSPIVDAGAGGTICANAADVTLSGMVTGATGGVWSGGTGTFNPNNLSLSATYTPSAAEIAAGTVTLTLTSAGNGTCNPVSDQVTWTITPSPTVNAGADQTLCANNANAVLNAQLTVATGVQWSGGTGLYSPGSTAQNITYGPSPVELANGSVTLTVTTTGNGTCAAVSDQVTLTFSPAPTVNAGPDQSVSGNNADTQLAGSFTVSSGATWSGGAGSYAPSNTALNAVYTPTASEIAAGSVTLTLTTVGNGSCAAVSDQMTITFTDPPTVDAGPDQTVCANAPAVSLSGSVTVASGGIWTGGGGTFNPNNTSLIATYTPSAAEIAAGSVTLTLTSVGNGNSNPVSDQVVITITPAPVAEAGPALTSCANQPNAQLAGTVSGATGGIWSGGSGSFSPSTANLNAVYTPSPAEIAAGSVILTLTTTGNGLCNAVSDQVTLSIVPAPVVNAGVDLVTCSNNPTAVLNGSVTNAGGGIWSGGTGGFSPNITALGAAYTPSATELANGSVTLTLTSTGNGTCAAVSDDVLLVFSQAPTVNAGTDVTVCANAPQVSLNGSVTIAGGGSWSGGGGSFAPNANTLNATYTPSPAEIALGTVTLTLTSTQNGDCLPVTDQMTITILPAPVADAGAPISVCSNNAVVQLGGSVTGAGGGQWSGGAGTFAPSIASLNAVYTPTAAEIAAGTLTLTLTTIGNGACQAVTDDVLITFTAIPTAEAGTGGVLCANNASIALNGAVTVATGGTWSGAQGTFSPNANSLNAAYSPSLGELAAGEVTLVLSTTGNGGCLSVSDSVTYTFSPAPTANAGPDATTCANNASVTLAGSVTVATGGLWSGGNGTFSPNAGSLNATYVPTAAEITTGSVTLTLTTVGNGTCNAVADDMLITITSAPVVDAGAALTSCANDPAVQLAGSVSGATGGLWTGQGTFTPSAAALNATYLPSATEVAAGTAVLTLTSTGNGLCNAVSDMVTLTIGDAPVVNAGPDQTLCANNATVQLAGAVQNATGGSWSGGQGSFTPSSSSLNAAYTPSASELSAGAIWLFLTSTGNGLCDAVRDSLLVTFTPAPTASVGADLTVCANDPEVQLNGSVTVATGGSWSGGNGIFTPNNSTLNATYMPSLSELAAGTVQLALTTTGNGNCVAVSDTLVVDIDPVPVVNAGPDQQVCANNPAIQLNGFVGNAPGAIWSGGNGTYFPNTASLVVQYQPTAAEIAAGSVTFTLTSVGSAVCAPISDQVTVVFTDSPVADAGADQQVCMNNAAVQLAGNVLNANGGQWSGGNGTFTPAPNVFNPVYQPTASELASGSVTLYLTTTGNGTCFSDQDTVTITFTPAPTVDAGVDLQVCANNPVIDLNGTVTVASGATWSGGLGTFLPNAQTLNAQYQPSNFELGSGSFSLTLTTTGNGNCLAVSDQLTVTVLDAPTVDAGPDLTTCSSDLDIELDGEVLGTTTTGIWTTSGTGTFFPSAAALNATYLASSLDSLNGTVDLTLTSTNNGLCNAVMDQLTVTILPNATADAGPDQVICASDVKVMLEGLITGNATQGTWTTTGAGTFTPNANSATASYWPDSSDLALGTLTFTWSVNSCDNAQDQMTVTIVPVSVVDAGADLVTCFDDLDVVINGSVSGANTTGQWSTLGSGTFANPTSALSNVYQASLQDSLALGVDLVLTATGTGACPADADTLHIDILPFGTVDAGADMTFCANNTNVQLTGTLTGDATQVLWTTSGTGIFFPNAGVLNPTYIPSAVDTAIGSLTLTLSAVNTCNTANDALTLTLTPAPYVNAGPDQTFCNLVTTFTLDGTISGVTNVGQWTTTGSGTIANPGALTTTYTASAADIAAGRIDFTLSSLNNGNCAPVSDQMTIWLTDGIIADAGPDQSVCVLSDHAQLQGAILNGSPTGTWTTTGSGTFSPDPDALNAQYYFSPSDVANGSVVLTLTSTNTGTCPTVQDQLVLTFGNSSFADAGYDLTTCANSPVVQLNGNVSGGAQGGVWSTSGTGSFNNTSFLDPTYTLSASDLANGSVTLTLTTITGGACLPVSDQVTVTVNGLPAIDAGSDQIVCTADPVTLNAFVSNASGVLWTSSGTGTFFDATAATTLYYPSAADSLAGSVQLTVTTTGMEPCGAVSDQLEVAFGGGLEADAGPDVVTCSTQPNVALTGSVAGTTTGQWSTTGTGSFTPSNTALNATYVPGPADFIIGDIALVLTTTNNLGCPPARDTLIVSYHLPPTVNAGQDVLLCDGIEPVQLAASAQHHDGIQWFTTGTGGFSTDTIPDPVYTPSAADSVSGGVYLVVTAFGTGGCANASDSILIDIGPTRIADAGADQALCGDGTPIQLNGAITGVSGGQWSCSGSGTFLPDATTLNAVYTPSPADLVTGQLQFLLATTGNMGCPADVDTLVVTLQTPPTASAGPDQSTCSVGDLVDLAGSFTGAGGVQWTTTGSGTFLPDAFTATAQYQPSAADSVMQQVMLVLTTTGNQACPAAADTAMLSFVNPLSPAFSASNLCAGSEAMFTDASTSGNSSIIGWNWTFPGGVTASGPQVGFTFPTAGQYAVTLTLYADNGCTASLTQVFDVLAAPSAGFSIEGEPFTGEEFIVTDNSFGATGWWYDFGDGQGSLDAEPTHVFTEAGQYIVVQTVSNAAGCTDSDSVLVSIETKDILPPRLPNAFSPNGDGVNDVFYVRGGPFETIDLKVYNGWGELIFETTDPEFGWDGTRDGTPEINGVYVYTVQATSTDGREHDRTGKITLIR